jgi:hypothetical protein
MAAENLTSQPKKEGKSKRGRGKGRVGKFRAKLRSKAKRREKQWANNVKPMLNWPEREGEPRAQLPESTKQAKKGP